MRLLNSLPQWWTHLSVPSWPPSSSTLYTAPQRSHSLLSSQPATSLAFSGSGFRLGSYFITNRYTLSYVLDVDLGAADRQQSRLRHASDMVISYLCDRSGEAA